MCALILSLFTRKLGKITLGFSTSEVASWISFGARKLKSEIFPVLKYQTLSKKIKKIKENWNYSQNQFSTFFYLTETQKLKNLVGKILLPTTIIVIVLQMIGKYNKKSFIKQIIVSGVKTNWCSISRLNPSYSIMIQYADHNHSMSQW